jgi:hypothetical protein
MTPEIPSPDEGQASSVPPVPPEQPAESSVPATEPAGSLVPPPRQPPTALASAAAQPPRPPRRFSEPWRVPGWRRPSSLAPALAAIFDALDTVADRIAFTLGLPGDR